MRKLILLFALVSSGVFFNSCEKDSLLEDEPRNQTSKLSRNSTCSTATNITTSVNETTVEIRFDAVVNGTLHRVFFRKVGETNFKNFSTYVNAASISNLEKNTKYELKVRTLCGSIGAPPSGIVKFTTGDSDYKCGKVIGLKNETPTENSVQITFGTVHGITKYLIKYKSDADEFPKSVFSSFPLFTLTDLTPNTKYEISVKAICGGFVGGIDSAPITITTADGNTSACAAPTNVTATANETAVTILFDASNSSSATQYSIAYRKVGSSAIFSGLSTMVNGGSISALDPNTEYEIKVRTLCGEIGSSWSPIVKVTTGASPYQCGGVVRLNVSDIEETKARLTFGTVKGSSQYLVFYKKVGAEFYSSKISHFGLFTLQNLEPGTNYQATIKSQCGEIGAKNSNVVNFKTAGTACNRIEVGLKLTLDNYGSEISFVLKKADGEIIKEGGTFENGTDGQVITESFSLQDGNYELTIKDSYGDGICCDYGNGSFDLVDASGNVIQAFDGNFGTEKKVSFTIQNCEIGTISVQKDARRRMLGKKKKN